MGQPEHGQNVTASDSAEVLASEARIAVNKGQIQPLDLPAPQ